MNETTISDKASTAIARRSFLGLSVAGAVGASVGVVPTLGAPQIDEPCQHPTASSVLAIFSFRAWQLPNKLKEATAAQQRESEIFASFEIPLGELIELVKKLKVQCAAVTKNTDPRIKELTELADSAVKSVRYLNASSTRDQQTAYLNLVTLVAAGKQITRTATDVASEHLPDDPEILCKMIEKIKEMEKAKVQLDEARRTSQAIFGDFVNTIGEINRTIISASQQAALFERGETSDIVEAVSVINSAQSKLTELADLSGKTQDGPITPQELRMLLEVPKLMLANDIPIPTSFLPNRKEPFELASYDPAQRKDDATYANIRTIITRHILPSDWWTVRLLALAVFGVLRLYGDNPPRTRLVRNALQSVPWVSPNSNISGATRELVTIVI